MFKFRTALLFASSLLVAQSAAAIDAAKEAQLRDAVHSLAPNAPIDAISESPVSGFYEVNIGPSLLYISADGRFLFEGDIYDTSKRVNLTENKRRGARADAVEGIGEENMMVFSPKNPNHTVTVFTDIDCGYCRKLHREMSDYTDAGIKVRYLMYPRAGVNSEAYRKAVSSWCADDPKATMTRAKQGKSIEAKTCANPIQAHMAMGEALGVTGTPSIVLEDGEIVPGYVPARKLKAMLDARTTN